MKHITYKEEISPTLAPPRLTNFKGITLSVRLHELSGELCHLIMWGTAGFTRGTSKKVNDQSGKFPFKLQLPFKAYTTTPTTLVRTHYYRMVKSTKPKTNQIHLLHLLLGPSPLIVLSLTDFMVFYYSIQTYYTSFIWINGPRI